MAKKPNSTGDAPSAASAVANGSPNGEEKAAKMTKPESDEADARKTEKDAAEAAVKGRDDSYQAESITVLKGLEAVRKRPAMYIGSTGLRGLHHLVYEVVDNAIDEALAGYCNQIDVTVRKDQSVVVVDNGRGIPVDLHKEQNKPAVEVVMTVLHAGGKFDSKSYKVSGGLHGVGVSVVNALSDWLEVEVSRDGYVWHQRYERGDTATQLKKLRKTADTGTKVTFHPDPEIFDEIEFNDETLVHRLRELAYLNRGITIAFEDERTKRKETFHYEGGIAQFVEYLNEAKEAIHAPPVHFGKSRDGVEFEVALQWNDTYVENIYSFANNINTTEGGTHLSGFKTALTRTLNNYAAKNNLFKSEKWTLQGEDTREGLTAVVSVRLVQPQFEGQTKTKLGNSEVRGIAESVVGDGLSEYLEEHPNVARKILDKCATAARSREAARKAKELTRRKSALESGSLPGKLADCSFTEPELCEIYIVEGESAGGSAKQGRDRRFQAILPIKGKILNVEKARLDKMLGNEEIRTIITALGTGIDEEEFDIAKARYGKTIIMTDADVDGSHIRTLLLTFFYRHMRKLIENGKVYIAQPPLYRLKKGKAEYYAFNDREKDRLAKELGKQGVTLQRYKGLGEMNPEQLWKTTMDPETRTILQVDIEDAADADRIFSILMGEKVEPRREFIERNAASVKNLDV
jgi:DNA gyrase subunit B